MKLLKVMNAREWAVSHGFILAGLILITVMLAVWLGPGLGGLIALPIIAIWCFALGLCVAFGAMFGKLLEK